MPGFLRDRLKRSLQSLNHKRPGNLTRIGYPSCGDKIQFKGDLLLVRSRRTFLSSRVFRRCGRVPLATRVVAPLRALQEAHHSLPERKEQPEVDCFGLTQA